MNLTTQGLDLTLTTPFRISRSVQHVANNLHVRIEADNVTGEGEAAPSAEYGERCDHVIIALSYLEEALGDNPSFIEDISVAMRHVLDGNASAKAAIDMALYDLAGRRLGVPVYQLLGLNPDKTPVTSFTIGIDTPKEMARKAREASDFSILKIKVGTENDLENVRAIRDVTNATLRVDANAAWSPKQAIRAIEALEPYGIEFVEQPVARHDLGGLRFVRERVSLPIIADESCVTLDDVARVAECVDGINIKLMKCGGLTPALKMIAAARAHHLKVMLGCMVESSLAITAAAHLSPLVDYADLDGHLLVSDDPFDGVRVERGKLLLPDRPGLGIRRRAGVPRAQNDEASQSARKRGGTSSQQ